MNHFISATDVTNIQQLVNKGLQYKLNPLLDAELGKGKRIGLLFLNPSLRTRLSTQVAAANLGMEAIVFNVDKEGWALEFQEGAVMNGTTVEHIKDAAPVLGQYFDILAIRTFPTLKNKEEDYSEMFIKQFIRFAGVPVVSLESATLHPLQSLTDIITIQESIQNSFASKRTPKVVLTWAPHIKPLPQCVANSFSQWVNAWGGANFVITHPEGYELSQQFTNGATIVHDQNEALKEADFVYVKNWSSYEHYGQQLNTDQNWMLTNDKLALTNQAKVMHCLPVRRNIELSDEILDGPNSLVTQQAGNRVWAAQAVLAKILNTLNQ
ncbi:MAG: acetylornithine carbamoyltransferase [Sphingobacteriia bacterium 24-36-13]|jgi:N-succinyl-L-ornithine transcarbamylase|uniref:N-acetylornithine carbamoyltransferase n=1 Tax=Sediminibacterium sp. TaxID=1917865 RepID=UPI000BD992CC|nr:N-acetylornithine carbamoyltransferase [Sediminibacterium sp.]OYY10513.1 MAG: acetylornithine carbamoyltransferase [Sphingobacteriia bacterium 35-36-14]OYZ52608.1 MAG: acetylornithine carbamoyltransferase [Sphingobacteriia bacterium 24-36-13]OZA63957.1 MAG: acetylornithine carbamoyltransferase [Sphingobacteriia bacterium 39-36-14]HQS25432.1 N-acetylornithine carbamoyltransferase [Sediminibacterium sp.]HQS35771.1 N-acetylornithine carbamoyltransferase [Sediminibacterium sp.]